MAVLTARVAERWGSSVQYGAQFSATKNVNLNFLPWSSRKGVKFDTQLASAFSLHISEIKSIINTDQVKMNSAYEPCDPDQARAYPGFFNMK